MLFDSWMEKFEIGNSFYPRPLLLSLSEDVVANVLYQNNIILKKAILTKKRKKNKVIILKHRLILKSAISLNCLPKIAGKNAVNNFYSTRPL